MLKKITVLCMFLIVTICGCSGKRLSLTEKGKYNVAGYGQSYTVYVFNDLPDMEVHSFTSSDNTCTTYLLVEADDGDGQGVSYGSFSLYDSEAAYRFTALSNEGFLLSDGEQSIFVTAEDMHENSGLVDIHNVIPEDVEWVYPSSFVFHTTNEYFG